MKRIFKCLWIALLASTTIVKATPPKFALLRVATNGTFAPFSYYQGTKLSGFEIELIESLEKKRNVRIEWKIVPFDATLIGLQQDRYDVVIASHGITEERKTIVDFSQPYYCTGAVLLSKKGGVLRVDQLPGKRLGTQVGTTYFEYLKKLPSKPEVKSFKSETDTLTALINGKIDAMVGDKFAALATLKARPELSLQVGELLFQERIGMALKKKSPWLALVNEHLKQSLQDGTYEALSKKYFNQDIRCH